MVNITTDKSILDDKDLNFVDMHHHSNVSDGSKSPEFLAKHFIKHKKGLCITDHNEIKGSVYLSKQKQLFSIPSIEITSREYIDVLAYFYNVNDLINFWEKKIKNNKMKNILIDLHRTKLTVFDLVDKIHDYNGISALAHPLAFWQRSYKILFNNFFLKKIKAIELFNVGYGKPKQINFVRKFNKPITAGTDSHRISHFNILTAAYSYDIDSFLDSILKKKNMIYYDIPNFFRRLLDNTLSVKRNILLKF